MTHKPKQLTIFTAALFLIFLGQAVPTKAANPEHIKKLLETKECSECDLSEANLSGANLSFAILINANLRGANLKGANLKNADLTRANLSQADLRQANLNHAYLTQANLDQTNLTGASTTATRGLPVIAFPSLPQLVSRASTRRILLPPPPPPISVTFTPPPVYIPPISAPRRVPPVYIPPISASPIPRLRAAESSSSLFDTIPQVIEVRKYFQQRWKPPAGLTQSLEYTLQIAADGTIQRIIPHSEAAATNLDRAGIPSVGEPFVSPLSKGENLRIQVVLEPDSNVKVFQDFPKEKS